MVANLCDSTNESEVYCMIVSGSGKFIGYGLRIENGDKEDPHRRYLHHSLTSTRHRYSPESNNSVAIAIRSLKDRFVTIVSLTLELI